MRNHLRATVLAAAAVTAGIATVAPGAAAAPAPQYRLVLNSLTNSEYRGINARGDIIGVAPDPARFGREEGFVIKAGTTTPVFLADPGTASQDSRPRSINDQGVIVGNYQQIRTHPGREITRPAIWPGPGGAGSDLGVDAAESADAFGINDNQQIVGWQGNQAALTPWQRNGTTVTNLPPLAGSNDTEAVGENNNGVVVGRAALPGDNQAAVAWTNGKLSTLGQLNGGTWSEALAINSAGQAVGSAAPAGSSLFDTHAVLFSGGKAIDLNVRRGVNPNTAHATAINTSGVIVGDDAFIDPLDVSGLNNGFVYRNGHATELNTLIAPVPNVRLAGATGINDAGDIVGTAVLTAPDGVLSTAGYELLPIPAS